MDQVKTNGESYQVTGNTGYLCHTVGGGVLDNQSFWLGFYRDGTISYTRRDGLDTLYTPLANPANCSLALDNAAHSIRYVVLESTVTLDASKHLTHVASQLYYTAPPTLTDNLAITCTFKNDYGVAQ